MIQCKLNQQSIKFFYEKCVAGYLKLYEVDLFCSKPFLNNLYMPVTLLQGSKDDLGLYHLPTHVLVEEIKGISVIDMDIHLETCNRKPLSLGLGLCQIILLEGRGEWCVKGWVGIGHTEKWIEGKKVFTFSVEEANIFKKSQECVRAYFIHRCACYLSWLKCWLWDWENWAGVNKMKNPLTQARL